VQRAEYEASFALEGDNWWYRAKRDMALRLAARSVPASREARILDAGCGTGHLLQALARRRGLIGMDGEPFALEFATRRAGCPLLCGSLQSIPLRAHSFDVVFALDVLEHLDDDRAGAAELARVLAPGGALVATVPAWPALWSDHDVRLGHRRRYTRRAFRSLLEGAGFRLERLSYYNSTLLVPIALRIGWSRLAGRAVPSESLRVGRLLNAVLYRIMDSEGRLIPWLPLPAGVSLVTVARAPG
jgi:SAM-dependent methyltransferase